MTANSVGVIGVTPGAKYGVSTKIAHKGFLVRIILFNRYPKSGPSGVEGHCFSHDILHVT